MIAFESNFSRVLRFASSVAGHDANKEKIWTLSDMDADHVAAWSKGGKTTIKNCEMLCKTHNRAKGNR